MANTLVRPVLWFCAGNLLAAGLAAQCVNPTTVPNQTISSGTVTISDSNSLLASGVTINGSANVSFVSPNCIQLDPGFHATAGSAATTFHAWIGDVPQAVSVTPSSGGGWSQQFAWTASSTSGYSNLSEMYLLFNTSISGQGACYIRYNRASNLLYLATNGYWSGGMPPGYSGLLDNGQCSFNGTQASVSASGNQVTVTMTLSFQPAFAGAKNLYMLAVDNSGLNSGWQPMGTWTAGTLNITTTSLPWGTLGAYYTASLNASGGTPPYSWSIASGSLPPGLTLSSGGTISGTPTAAGSFSFTPRVTDSVYTTSTRPLGIAISSGTLTITTTSLPGASVGGPYSASLAVSGGAPPYTWSISAGSLSPGLSLWPNGAISGTPTTTGTYSFTARVQDATTLYTTKALSITVGAGVTITTASLNGATRDQAYSAQLAATGGTGSYTWSVASGTLPPGLTLSTAGLLSGTPTASGTWDFTVRAMDTGSASATKALTLTVSAPVLQITIATPLASGAVGTAYSATLSASGGTAPYTWALASGSTLPPGLSLSGAAISGTPATAGTYNFTVQVTDSASTTTTKAMSLAISAAPTYTVSGNVNIAGCPLSGVTVTITGGGNTFTPSTNATGAYTVTVPGYVTYTVSPAKQNYTFTPATITNLSSNQTQNFAASGPQIPSREYIRLGGRVVAIANCGAQ